MTTNPKRNGIDSYSKAIDAISEFDDETLESLLDSGLSEFHRGPWSLLNEAAYCGNPSAIRILASKGADVEFASGAKNSTPVFSAVLGLRPGRKVECLNALALFGADLNAVNSEGDSLMHVAAKLSTTTADVVVSLYRLGANPSSLNRKGQTPLDCSTRSQVATALRDVIDGCFDKSDSNRPAWKNSF